ncbi:MAG: hypothetical protein KDD64_07830 [Bdellovibrionales bacterium]|nr:hypothetical protein [Bdellovibrionales bacterium]
MFRDQKTLVSFAETISINSPLIVIPSISFEGYAQHRANVNTFDPMVIPYSDQICYDQIVVVNLEISPDQGKRQLLERGIPHSWKEATDPLSIEKFLQLQRHACSVQSLALERLGALKITVFIENFSDYPLQAEQLMREIEKYIQPND